MYVAAQEDSRQFFLTFSSCSCHQISECKKKCDSDAVCIGFTTNRAKSRQPALDGPQSLCEANNAYFITSASEAHAPFPQVLLQNAGSLAEVHQRVR